MEMTVEEAEVLKTDVPAGSLPAFGCEYVRCDGFQNSAWLRLVRTVRDCGSYQMRELITEMREVSLEEALEREKQAEEAP